MEHSHSAPFVSAEDCERGTFHLHVLFETVRELSLQSSPGEVMQSFILMSMGALGTSQAFVLGRTGRTSAPHMHTRGIAAAHRERIAALLKTVQARMGEENDVVPHQACIVGINEAPSWDPELTDVRLLVEWFVDARHYGVLGYGAKISGAGYDAEDEAFVLRLVSAFMDAMQVAMAGETVRQLNDALQQKNLELEDALQDAHAIQADLDRRYFHFKSICETTRELSATRDARQLLSSFLLSVMGIFSARTGFAVLWNRPESSLAQIARGYVPEEGPVYDLQRMDAVFRELIHPPFVPAIGKKQYHLLTQAELSVVQLPGEPRMVAAFTVDMSHYGLVGLGPSLTDDMDRQPDMDLLSTLVQSFLVNLGNALAFATIEKLNSDLLIKNQELQQTLDELRQSRQTITLLESARNRLRTFLQTETLRIKRVSMLDCIALAVISLVLGMVFNASNPGGIPLRPQTWDIPKAQRIDPSWAGLKHESRGALFLDARPVEFFDQSRIAGAENLPLNLFDFVYSMRFAMLPPDQEIVVYGRNISRRYDELVAAKLMERGMRKVRVLSGGLRGWKDEGFPVEP